MDAILQVDNLTKQYADFKLDQEEIFRYYFLRQPQRVIGVHIGRTRSTAGRHIQLALKRLRRLMEAPFFPTTPDISAIFPKYTGRSTPRLRNM